MLSVEVDELERELVVRESSVEEDTLVEEADRSLRGGKR